MPSSPSTDLVVIGFLVQPRYLTRKSCSLALWPISQSHRPNHSAIWCERASLDLYPGAVELRELGLSDRTISWYRSGAVGLDVPNGKVCMSFIHICFFCLPPLPFFFFLWRGGARKGNKENQTCEITKVRSIASWVE